MKDKELFGKYLALSKKYNPTGTWWTTRTKLNRAEYIITKVREFINKNPRLRSLNAKMLKEDYRDIIKGYGREITKL